MKIARMVAERSPCTRRKFGAIIVKDDAILSTGYNGSARGTQNCGEDVPCLKDLYGEKPYESHTYCPAVHAEVNAIINAARQGVSILGADMYLDVIGNGDMPCPSCRRVIINAGIRELHFRRRDGTVVVRNNVFFTSTEDQWIERTLKSHSSLEQ